MLRAQPSSYTPIQMPIPSSNEIADFWRANPDLWSPKVESDTILQQRFAHRLLPTLDVDIDDQSMYGQIIFLDEIIPRLGRNDITDAYITYTRKTAVAIVRNNLHTIAHTADEFGCLCAMKPFFHCEEYTPILEFLHNWLNQHADITINDAQEQVGVQRYSQLQRLYEETYRRLYLHNDSASIAERIIYESPDMSPETAQFESILCDNYSPLYASRYAGEARDARESDHWETYVQTTYATLDPRLLKPFSWELGIQYHKKPRNPVLFCIDGGVCSTVLLTLRQAHIKHTHPEQKQTLYAVYIARRNCTEHSCECRFLTNYCFRIGVPLFVYHIDWIRQGNCDETFYEETTQQIKENVQKHIVQQIQKISGVGTKVDVLDVTDTCSIGEIYELRDLLKIPHLKSCYVDDIVSSTVRTIKCSYFTYKTYRCDITRAVRANSRTHIWGRILSHICGTLLKTGPVSQRSIEEFHMRIQRTTTLSHDTERALWFIHIKRNVGVHLMQCHPNRYVLQVNHRESPNQAFHVSMY